MFVRKYFFDGKNIFFSWYQYKIVILIKEIYYTLMVPFKLYKLSFNVHEIINKLHDINIITAKYGNVNKYALFDQETIDKKTLDSIETFRINNPDW